MQHRPEGTEDDEIEWLMFSFHHSSADLYRFPKSIPFSPRPNVAMWPRNSRAISKLFPDWPSRSGCGMFKSSFPQLQCWLYQAGLSELSVLVTALTMWHDLKQRLTIKYREAWQWPCLVIISYMQDAVSSKVSLPLLSQFAAESWQPGQIEAGER